MRNLNYHQLRKTAYDNYLRCIDFLGTFEMFVDTCLEDPYVLKNEDAEEMLHFARCIYGFHTKWTYEIHRILNKLEYRV